MRLSDTLAVLLLHVLCPIAGRPESLNYGDFSSTKVMATTIKPSTTRETSYKYLPIDNSTGCKALLLTNHPTLYFYGSSCHEVPRRYQFNVQQIGLKSTKIVTIRRIDFISWYMVLSLVIEMNPDLTTINDGVFSNCSRLINLTISNNAKLTHLSEDVFDGLVNLRNLGLRKNGFLRLSMVATVARPSVLPNLITLDGSENTFNVVQSDDLVNLTDSMILDFKLNLCSLTSVESNSLRFLASMNSLSLNGNNLDAQNITGLIENLKTTASDFTRLSIAANMLQTDPVELFRSISETNISYLNLRETHFTSLDINALPIMQHLVHLDLTNIKAIATSTEVFSYETFPNLRSLILARNNYLGTAFKFDLPNLNMLDLSSYSCDAFCDTSYEFKLDDFQLKGLESLEILLLNNNVMYNVHSGKFNGMNNLTKLVLGFCSIYRIYPHAFSNLNKLEYLDLGYNTFRDIRSLVTASFDGLKSLRVLILESCAINVLKSRLFDNLINLEVLNLRYNGISHVEPTFFALQTQLTIIDLTYNTVHKWERRVFTNNSKLNEVVLSNNLIEELTTSMLHDFETVSHLNLFGNPLACTCSEIGIVAAQNSHAIVNMLENEKSSPSAAYCSSPISMMNTPYSNFILSSMIDKKCEIPVNTAAVISVVTIVPSLLFFAIICYILRWHIKYWLFLLRQVLRCYYFPKNRNRKSGGQYRYDAFVSYSHEDRSFVVKLVAMLESHEPFFSLCVFERDFTVGGAITESVFDCLTESRRTILILSKAFAQSTWCQWELQLAHNKKLVFKDDTVDPLIIIKLGDIEESCMTPGLRYLTKTRIYLQWNSDPIKQKLFWRRLRSALARPERIVEGRCNPACTE